MHGIFVHILEMGAATFRWKNMFCPSLPHCRSTIDAFFPSGLPWKRYHDVNCHVIPAQYTLQHGAVQSVTDPDVCVKLRSVQSVRDSDVCVKLRSVHSV